MLSWRGVHYLNGDDMKNSEIKKIIRHIDRLTRSLNARGRRRDAADSDEQRKEIERAKAGVKTWSQKALDAARDIQIGCKSLDSKFADFGDFEQCKRLAKQDVERNCKALVKALNQVVDFCDDGIKAQRA